MRPPVVGEVIYGCRHLRACGVVQCLHGDVDDIYQYTWTVSESWEGRQVRVMREPDGKLYEVEVSHA